jgi:hypothetical protein
VFASVRVTGRAPRGMPITVDRATGSFNQLPLAYLAHSG